MTEQKTQTQTQTIKNVKGYFKAKIKEVQEQIKTNYLENKTNFKNYTSNHYFYKKLISSKMLNDNKLTNSQFKNILLENVIKYYKKSEQKQLEKLNKIYECSPVRHGKIAVDWVKNRTWGNCPRGSYANCFRYVEHKAVTGCGYDKLSTLTASFLNDDINFLRVLVDFIDKKHINTNKKLLRDVLGYGIRTSEGLPYMEGAVGASCHVNILKNLGFNVAWHETAKSDIFLFDVK